MKTKHQPATALPWIHEQPRKCISAIVGAGQRYVVAGSLICAASRKKDAKDHAYITHAANAYRDLVLMLGEAVRHRNYSDMWINDARNLLRQLGES